MASDEADPWATRRRYLPAQSTSADDPLFRLFAPVAVCAALLNLSLQIEGVLVGASPVLLATTLPGLMVAVAVVYASRQRRARSQDTGGHP